MTTGKALMKPIAQKKPGKQRRPKSERRSKWRPEYADIVGGLCLIGYQDNELAEYYGISENTLITWKKRHPRFNKEILNARDLADARVAQGLLKRAEGFDFDSEKIFYDGKTGQIVRAATKTYVPPDVAAAETWLSRRAKSKEKWAPKKDPIDINVKHGLAPADMERLESMIADSAKRLQDKAKSKQFGSPAKIIDVTPEEVK